MMEVFTSDDIKRLLVLLDPVFFAPYVQNTPGIKSILYFMLS